MRAIVSYHPVDLTFFDRIACPLIQGRPADGLDSFLDDAVRTWQLSGESLRWARAVRAVLLGARPPKPPPILGRDRSPSALLRSSAGLVRSPGVLLKEVKTRLDQLDHRLDPLARVVLQKIDSDLHLFGRPFLITESSATGVASAVDRYRRAANPRAVANLALEQLITLDPLLARIEPAEPGPVDSELSFRSDVFRQLQSLAEIPKAAKHGLSWTSMNGTRKPAAAAMREDLAWLAANAHARVQPYWVARDVDGLFTMCERAGIAAPRFLQTSARLFHEAGTVVEDLAPSFSPELEGPQSVGAFVEPNQIEPLLDFLTMHGSRVIRAASRKGEGKVAATLLMKIRECAVYARQHGLGYLEMSGILPPACSLADFASPDTDD